MRNLKYILLMLVLTLCAGQAWADDIPYRQQMREIYRQLPITQDDIVFLGNSITDFGLWSEFFGDDPHIKGRGIQGIESPEVLQHLSLIGSGHPKKLFLMIGINDFEHPATVVPNIRKMIETMQRESPTTELYMQSILPCNLAARATVPPTLNPQIKALCEELGVTYVDIYGAMTQITGNTTMPTNMTDDSLHPNMLGYRLWCDIVAPLVGKASSIDAKATSYQKPLSRNIYKSILSEYQLLPVNECDYLHVGDYQVMTPEWGELMGTPYLKNRGLGGGYGWSLSLDEFNSAYASMIKGSPKAIFFQCGKRQLDDKPTDITTLFSKYQTAVQNIRKQAPNADIYLESIIPNADASVNTTSIIPFNQKIKALVDGDTSGKLHFVDVYAALEEGGILATRYQGANTAQSRGINGRAYVRWANVLAPYIEGAQPVREMTDAQAQLNDAMYDGLNTLWADASQDELRAKLAEAKALLQNEAATEEQCNTLGSAIMTIVRGQYYPKTSTEEATYYYTLSTPNRGTRYATSQGVGQDMMGNTTATEASYWKFVERADGKLDIVNYADHTYVSPASDNNTALKTQAASPASGWELKEASQEGLFIIVSGNVEWNQTNSPQNYRVYNWGGGNNTTDTGCQYQFTLVEGLTDGPIEYDYVGVEPGKTYRIINVQQNGDTHMLYADGGQLQIGTTDADAGTYGEKAQFLVEGHQGKVSFQNVDSKEYLIWRGNGQGYNSDKGTLATYTEPWCAWTVVASQNLTDGYYFYSTRSDASKVGSLVIMSGTSTFDAYGNSEGWDARFSNVYKFEEVPGDLTTISTVDIKNSQANHVYDLQGRKMSAHAHGIYLQNNRKVLR